MTIKAGDKVYRVVEYDKPTNEPFTWKIEERVVKSATIALIVIARWFSGMTQVQFKPGALGRLFFATSQEALNGFLVSQLAKVQALERRTRDVRRAMQWAKAKGAVFLD